MPQAVATVHIPAGTGIDEAVRPEWVEFGKSSLANENSRQAQRFGASKRYGFAAALSRTRADGTTGSQAYKIFRDGRQLSRVTYNTGRYQLETWDSISSRWVPLRGHLPECTTRTIDLPGVGGESGSPGGFLAGCAATTNGYVGISYLISAASSLYTAAAVINPTSGAIVSPLVQVGSLTSTSTPQEAVMVGVGVYLILIRRGTLGTIKAWQLDTTSMTTIASGWVAMTDLATDHGGGTILAVCSLPHASSPKAAIVYSNNSGGASRATVKTFNATGVLDTATINTSSVSVSAVDVTGSTSGTLWVAWSEATAVKAKGFDPANLASVTSATGTVITCAATCTTIGIANSSASGEGRMIACAGTSPPIASVRSWTTPAGTLTPSGSQVDIIGLSIWARPFEYDSRNYVAAYHAGVFLRDGDIAGSGACIVDWTENVAYVRPVANPFPGLFSLPGANARPAVVGSTVYHQWPVARSAGGAGGSLVELDFASTSRWTGALVGTALKFAGGVPYGSDGVRVAEEGFIHPPPEPDYAIGGGTGLTGPYRYVAVYEEIDAEGNWHQSGVSDPSVSITPLNQTVVVSVYPLVISDRVDVTSGLAATLRVALYRTLTGGEAPYYRLTTLANDTSAIMTYEDAVDDTTLATRAKLYSQPGVLGTAQDHRAPPSFKHVIEHLGMSVGLTEREVWCSGQPVYGEAPWYSPLFSQPFADGTALASQDGLVYAFTRRQVYALPCEPPSDNGTQGGLGAPQLLAADVGCVDPRSVVVTALGVFFQSERGIELLSRARNVEWIGESVQEQLSDFPVIVAARLDSLDSLVYFECVESETSGQVSGNGRTLVFDLTLQQWVSVDRRKDGAGVADVPAQDACVVCLGGVYRYAWLDPDGSVYVQDRSTYLDAGSFVTQKWEPAECKLGLQAQHTIYAGMLLFERHSAAGLKLEFAYDGAAYDATLDDVWTEADTNVRQLEFRTKTTAQRVRFRLTDTAPAVLGTGQGFTWIGISVDVARQGGPTRSLPHIAVSGRK